MVMDFLYEVLSLAQWLQVEPYNSQELHSSHRAWFEVYLPNTASRSYDMA